MLYCPQPSPTKHYEHTLLSFENLKKMGKKKGSIDEEALEVGKKTIQNGHDFIDYFMKFAWKYSGAPMTHKSRLLLHSFARGFN